MRRAQVRRPDRGELDGSPLLVELQLDGRDVVDEHIEPRGFHKDGLASMYRRLTVPAGPHELRVRLRDHPDQATASWQAVRHVDLAPAQVLVIDSIQTLTASDIDAAAGSTSQIRECAHRLVGEAKRRGVPIVLVGHVTKEGGLAGPRVLEHVVDTVLSFEGDRHHSLRLLRAVKHRFGPTNELGVFESFCVGSSLLRCR